MVELEPVEERISELEKAIENADRDLCDRETLSDSELTTKIMIERKDNEEKLLKLMEKWEHLMRKINEIETGYSAK
jgi:hypothetical protein